MDDVIYSVRHLKSRWNYNLSLGFFFFFHKFMLLQNLPHPFFKCAIDYIHAPFNMNLFHQTLEEWMELHNLSLGKQT